MTAGSTAGALSPTSRQRWHVWGTCALALIGCHPAAAAPIPPIRPAEPPRRTNVAANAASATLAAPATTESPWPALPEVRVVSILPGIDVFNDPRSGGDWFEWAGERLAVVLPAGARLEDPPAEVRAFDTATRRRLWATAVAWQEPGPYSARVSHGPSGARVIVWASKRVSALDAATGVVAWSAAAPGDLLDARTDRLLFADADGVVALVARDAQVAWRAQSEAEVVQVAAASDRFFVLTRSVGLSSNAGHAVRCPERDGPACARDLVVLSARDGSFVTRIPLRAHTSGASAVDPGALVAWLDNRGLQFDAALDDARVYIGVRDQIHGIRAARVAAYDVKSGRLSWQTPAWPCGMVTDVNVQVEGSLVYTCTCDGILRKLEARTGAVQASLSVGQCRGFSVSGGTVVLERSLPPWDAGIARITADAWNTREERVSFIGAVSVADGVLELPTWARVGSELYRTDSLGRFAGSFRARGILSAEVAANVAQELTTPLSFVLLDGRPSYEITVATGVYE